MRNPQDRSILRRILALASVALAVSSVLDLWLWLTFRYKIPAWVFSVFMVGCIGLLLALISLLGSTKGDESTKRIPAGPRPGDSGPHSSH